MDRWFREHLIHRTKTSRMYEERSQFAQGHEHKACMWSRGWGTSAGLVNDALSIKQQIKIDRPRTRTVVVVPAKGALDFPQHAQQALRRDGCLQLYDAIEEPSGAGVGSVFDRLSLIEQRNAGDLRVRQQTQERHGTVTKSIRSPTLEPKPI